MVKAVAVRPKIPMDEAAALLAQMCDAIDAAEPTVDLDSAAGAAVVEAFNDAKLNLAEAVDRRIAWIAFVEGQIIAARAARDAWDAQKKRLEALLSAMRQRTAATISEHTAADAKITFRGRLGELSVRTNGGVLPMEVTLPPELTAETLEQFGIDERFYKMRVTYELDSAAVRKALEGGETLPWAKLGERGSHLRIRHTALPEAAP